MKKPDSKQMKLSGLMKKMAAALEEIRAAIGQREKAI